MKPIKSGNFLITPEDAGDELFRRNPKSNKSTVCSRRATGMVSTAQSLQESRSEVQMPQLPTCAERPDFEFPFRQVARMKILGVIFDKELKFEDHFAKTMDKAKVRMAVIARLAGSG